MTGHISYISSDEFVSKLNNGEKLDVLDVRSNLEHDYMCLGANTVHIPLHEINFAEFAATRADSNEALYILCKAGPRAEKAAQLLAHYGLENLVVIDGGISGCAGCGADIKKSATPVSPDDIGAAVQESVQAFMNKNT